MTGYPTAPSAEMGTQHPFAIVRQQVLTGLLRPQGDGQERAMTGSHTDSVSCSGGQRSQVSLLNLLVFGNEAVSRGHMRRERPLQDSGSGDHIVIVCFGITLFGNEEGGDAFMLEHAALEAL